MSRCRNGTATQRPVSALAFSPDGTRLASAGEDRIIRIWDIASGQQCAALSGHRDRIPALLWHPQGHRLYAAGWDTCVWVWDVVAAIPVILLNDHTGQVQALAISPDGTRLASADSAQTIHLWDLVSHKPIRTLTGIEGEVRCLAFRADGRALASGGSDRVVHVWSENSVDGGRWTANEESAPPASPMQRPPAPPSGLAVSPDGTRLASLCPGKGVRVWEVATQRKVLELDAPNGLNVIACSPDGRWIAAGGDDTAVYLWDAATGRRQAALVGPALPVTALAFSPNAPRLASASAIGCDVWLWNTDDGTPALILPDAIDGCSVEAVAFHPQGDRLAVGGIDWLATGGADGAIHIWDVVQPARRLSLVGGAHSLAFHPAGRLLAAATLVRTVRLWDTQTGRLVRELTGHAEAVNAVAFSPDGRRLASAADDYSVRLWDVPSGADRRHRAGYAGEGAELFSRWAIAFHRQRQFELLSTAGAALAVTQPAQFTISGPLTCPFSSARVRLFH